MRQLNAILILALRDVLKLLRDRARLVSTLIFPVLFIGALGGSLEASFSNLVGFSFITFVFTGVLGQNMFQSTATGIISLIEDRENDFSREIFVSPVSRYAIIFGKILGETLVSLTIALGIFIFGIIVGVPLTIAQVFLLIFGGLVASLFGGAFGVIVMANLSSQRTANQIFPLLIFPQFILGGVFNPIKELPPILSLLSYLSPMRYAVDFIRGLYYWGDPVYDQVVLLNPIQNFLIIAALFVAFLVIGTFLFVRNERNK